VAWSRSRAERLTFHLEPALHSWSQVYQRPGQGLDTIVDLDGRRVAVLEGSIQRLFLEELAENFGIAPRLVAVNSFDEGVTATREGRTEATVVNRHYGNWQALEQGLEVTPIMFQPARLFYAAPAGARDTVLERIDQHLTAWKPDSASPYHRILASWSVRSDDRFHVPAELRWGLAGLAMLLALATGFTLVLRRRVGERTAQLAQSEQRLATILDSVDAYIFIKTPDLRYAYVNRKVCELFQRPAEAIIGRGDEAFFDAATASRIRENDLKVVRHAERITEEEVNVLAEGGEPHVMLSVKLPLEDAADHAPSLCGIATDITAYRAIQARNHRLANFSPVTGLPNRTRLLAQLEQAIAAPNSQERPGRQAALLLLDLDRFKLVNDLHSHDEGDRLLQRVAEGLEQALGDTGFLAHLGSDEFAILIDDLDPPIEVAAHRVETLAERLLETVSAMAPSDTPSSTASIGLTLFPIGQGEAGGVLQQVDMALVQAKAAGGNTLRFFSEETHRAVMERVRLERDLQQALERNELVLHFQPQVDSDGRCVGLEALLRWQHPARGMIPPAAFIPLAEQTRLILPIGHWVLHSACTLLARWQGSPNADLRVAVNVSAVQFHEPGFVARIKALLEETGAPGERLTLEVTESLLMEDPERVRITLGELRALGIRLALDDFGTGYSSLNYLKRLPLDELKVDRSFVMGVPGDASDAAIVETTLTLAASLGLDVVAEGVEQPAQRDWLASRGCRTFQGYHFGRPSPLEALNLDGPGSG
ncbi:EAL domain-containing protein, partial [Halomonas campaniensis]|uniref:EAL domain-containing protein n=1 Tax=Halomonas campaniensis TaxID=213554 RepID=UPI003970FF9C